MDDLYGDLQETNVNEELNKFDSKNQIHVDEMTQLKNDLYATTEKCGVLEKENEQLKSNISTLFKTAQGEIIRKDRNINELRTELENLKFRRLKLQNRHIIHQETIPHTNMYNLKINLKNDCFVKPQSSFNKFQNLFSIEPNQVTEKLQAQQASGYNESHPNNPKFPSNYNYADPKLQDTFRNNYSDRNSPTADTMIRIKQETDMQPDCLYGNIVPKLDNDLITKLLPNHDIIKTEDFGSLEINIKQEFNDDENIPDIEENTDHNIERNFSPAIRKIRQSKTPDSNRRKLSPTRNSHRLVSKSISKEINSQKERRTRSPQNTKRFCRNNDGLNNNTQYESDKQGYRSRNRESNYPHKKRIYNDRSDYEPRYDNKRRRNCEDNHYNRRGQRSSAY